MKALIEYIQAHTRFEIITHAWPDEDAVGSSTALAYGLERLGKTVRVVYPTAAPEMLILDAPPKVASAFTPEISLLVDVSDPGMLKEVRPAGTVAIIDHHRTTTNYGSIRWVEASRSSASEMVFELLRAMDIAIDEAMASNLYMGIFGDTGGFTHANTSLRVFEIASDLVRLGADPHAIASRLKRNKPLRWYRILCLALERLIIVDGVYASYLTTHDFEILGATTQDASGIVEELASLAGADLSILARDGDGETVRCSMRSRHTPAARLTAEAFGGGGHDRAAGFTVPGRAAELIQTIVEEGKRWSKTA
ncbi:MAG: bifunctional oligoribonuclease/PAP phosphatase NrnA [Syntrophaceae bacterium]